MRFLCYIHTVLYSIHGVLHGTGPANSRNTEKSGVPQVSVKCKSGFGLVVLLPCVWNVCKVHTGMIRMGIKWRSPRRKGKPWSFFLGTWARELPDLTLPYCTRGPDWPRWHVVFLASAGVGGWLMDDGCQSIPRPWLNAYSHTHSLRGKSERERGTCEKVPVTFTLVFSPHFLGFLCCARFQKEVYCLCDQLLLSPWDWVGLGGWADWLMALFFWFFLFFIQATGERGRCVDNNNNNVTGVDPSRSLSCRNGYYYHHHHHTSELLLLLRAEQYSKKEKIKTTSRTLGLTDVHQDSQ